MLARFTCIGASLLSIALAGLAAAQCPPANPSNLSASDGTFCDHIALHWTGVTGENWYEIWRSQGTDYAFSTLKGTTTGTSFDDDVVLPGVHYYYWVTAWRTVCVPGSNRSDPSGRNQGTSGALAVGPGQPSVTTDRCDHVELSWNDITGASVYEVWRNIDQSASAPEVLVGTTPLTSLTDFTVPESDTTRYWVRARFGTGCVPVGYGSTAVGRWGVPETVSGLTATHGATAMCNHIHLAWNAALGAASYRVYRALTGSSDVVEIGWPTGTQFDDVTPLPTPPGGASYSVRAMNTCGSAPFSNQAAGTVCRADFNCSGTISVQDIFDFLAAYFTHDSRADINVSGSLTVQDIFDFLAAYFSGCA